MEVWYGRGLTGGRWRQGLGEKLMEAWSGRGLAEAELRPPYFRSRDAHAVGSGLKSEVSRLPEILSNAGLNQLGPATHDP
ncbi:hypothetical protein P7K49_037925 [Saguinus oedipus]|uniref:Uncharacterized protein n=1 Tax=Saguinus oedipus TaxID=9490 RepID=A0ABQ9TD77_SAGOE|nr:hypothetical protein P7K49_037925 [Saguinus oedipus]